MVRRCYVTVLSCLLVAWFGPSAAQAQQPAPSPLKAPRLRDSPKGGFGGQATATPAPTSTAHASPTATPTATATATATATPHATANAGLPNTGADPLRIALAGLTLLGFGLALRFRVALADARHPY